MSTEKLARYVKAGYPIIAITSYEEYRVRESIIGFIEQDYIDNPQYQQFRLYSWTVARGMSAVDTSATNHGIETQLTQPQVDPVAEAVSILQAIAAHDPEEAALFLLKDFHPYLAQDDSGPRYPDIVRALRDCAELLISRQQTIVLLSPYIKLPQDLRGVKVIDWPLPTVEELGLQLDIFLSEQGAEQALNGDREALLRALSGLTMEQADAILAEAFIAYRVIDSRAIGFILEAKAQVIKQNPALEYFPTDTAPSDVGGLDILKQWLQRAGKTRTEKARAMGIRPAKGALLVGVPGCGKSLTAKMVASMWKLPLIRWDIGSMKGSLVGESERNTRDALRLFDAVSPCVIWIDEIDKLLGSETGELDGGTSSNMLGQILSWMEETTAQVFIIATANDFNLRPELTRRFTETFFIDLPNEDERMVILEIHLLKTGQPYHYFEIPKLAEMTANFTGSELEQVVQQGLWLALDDGELTQEHLETAASEIVPLYRKQRAQIEAMREWASQAKPASYKDNGVTPVTVKPDSTRKLRA